MRQPPPRTPEALAHERECETVLGKVQKWLDDKGVPQVLDRRRGAQRGNFETSALRVVPTRDGTGRVHMALDQFCAVMGVTREELNDPDVSLSELFEK